MIKRQEIDIIQLKLDFCLIYLKNHKHYGGGRLALIQLIDLILLTQIHDHIARNRTAAP